MGRSYTTDIKTKSRSSVQLLKESFSSRCSWQLHTQIKAGQRTGVYDPPYVSSKALGILQTLEIFCRFSTTP
jgi:hypothetical protein